MTDFVANESVRDEIQDLHIGLQAAVDSLANSKDYNEGERIVRLVSDRLANLLDNLQSAR